MLSLPHSVKLQNTKYMFFPNTKDKTPSLSQSSVVYKFTTCPDCSCNYIGKRERTLQIKERKNMRTLTRSATNKLQFMNICQLASIIVTQWTCSMLIIIMLSVTNLTLTRLKVTLWFLKKQIIGGNCYLKKHY